jgi:dGTP triphosphohydrolase
LEDFDLDKIFEKENKKRELFGFDKEILEYLSEIKQKEDERLSPYATKNSDALRRLNRENDTDVLRTPFSIDIDKIVHNPLYNRYTDKTQVFSFYNNDDITRRATHVQLVSRVAKVIGRVLKLNLDLIESIAIGHDIGHTPFGHQGEKFLSELYYKNVKRYFNHNVHSVRILKTITNSNLTLQTLDGILCHNGEDDFIEYKPKRKASFDQLENYMEKCYTDKSFIKKLCPCTLEGCVVRISDMIAYVWKDRQDARKIKLVSETSTFTETVLGNNNIDFINNIIVNIIKNSLNQDYIKMDKEVFEALKTLKKENYEIIYVDEKGQKPYTEIVKPMMEKMYYVLCEDVEKYHFNSVIYQHYLNDHIQGNCYRNKRSRSIIGNPNDIVTDFIASMTDDYFIDLFKKMFPEDPLNDKINYVSYFENMK